MDTGKKSKKTGGDRYFVDCGEAGGDCTLRISGTYDEVLACGLEHARSAHGMKGEDEKLGEDLKGYIRKERDTSADYPESFQGRGSSQAGRSPGLPS